MRSKPSADYLVLIDELNRANVPKVFGDLLLTMESSKRASVGRDEMERRHGGHAAVLWPRSSQYRATSIYLAP